MKKNKKSKSPYASDTFDLSEVYRQLRVNIEFSQMDQEIKVISISSTQANEGKSTVAMNLAKVFADKYQKVLLIDGDLRNPTQHKFLKKSNASGLTNLLTHYTPEEDLLSEKEIQKVDTGSTFPLYFLSTGAKVANPSEFINSKRFASMLQGAKKAFDVVIVDTPPVTAVSDAIPISNQSDGTLYVVSSKETDKNLVKEALGDLERNGAHIIGTVLTKSPEFHSRRYKYYGYGYGYGQEGER